jgi:hypothetical protein
MCEEKGKEKPKNAKKRIQIGSLISVTFRDHSSQYDPLLHCRDFLPGGDVNSANAHSNNEVLDVARFNPLDEHYVQHRMVRIVFLMSARGVVVAHIMRVISEMRFFVVMGVCRVKQVAVFAYMIFIV